MCAGFARLGQKVVIEDSGPLESGPFAPTGSRTSKNAYIKRAKRKKRPKRLIRAIKRVTYGRPTAPQLLYVRANKLYDPIRRNNK